MTLSLTAHADHTSDIPTALLIDDEAPVRRLVQRMLEPDRCRIVEAAGAEMGLRILERNEPEIDLVITDLMMPGLDGLDVLAVLREHRPEMPLLVTSAFAGTIYPVFNRNGHFRILQKPFTTEALRDTVALLVDRAHAMRQRTVAMRTWASEVRAGNARLRHDNTERRRKLDLVAAAWAVHRERETERRTRDTEMLS